MTSRILALVAMSFVACDGVNAIVGSWRAEPTSQVELDTYSADGMFSAYVANAADTTTGCVQTLSAASIPWSTSNGDLTRQANAQSTFFAQIIDCLDPTEDSDPTASAATTMFDLVGAPYAIHGDTATFGTGGPTYTRQ